LVSGGRHPRERCQVSRSGACTSGCYPKSNEQRNGADKGEARPIQRNPAEWRASFGATAQIEAFFNKHPRDKFLLALDLPASREAAVFGSPAKLRR